MQLTLEQDPLGGIFFRQTRVFSVYFIYAALMDMWSGSDENGNQSIHLVSLQTSSPYEGQIG